jgi:SulP family sulfate permease
MMVAWNMSEMHHFRHLFKAPAGDVVVLLATFLLTVLVDLTVAVEMGMILAAFLFMKRIGEISKIVPLSKLEKEENKEEKSLTGTLEKKQIPPGVEVYEIEGPFFFGIADSLKSILSNLEFPPKVFILSMQKVPVIDASGMHALREFYSMCKKDGTVLLLSGVEDSLLKLLKKFGVIDFISEERLFPNIEQALKYASKIH